MRRVWKSVGWSWVVAVCLFVAVAYAAIGPTQSKWPVKVTTGPMEVHNQSGGSYWYSYYNPALGDTNTIKNRVATSASAATSVTFSSSDYATALAIPRTVTVRIDGTQSSINAGTITVNGTNMLGESISQDYTVTENTAATIAGTKAFKTLTTGTINVQDGSTGDVVVSFGTGDLLGLPMTMAVNGVLRAWAGTTVEGTAPTVTVSATDIELNTVDFNTAYNGTNDFMIYCVSTPYKLTTSDTR